MTNPPVKKSGSAAHQRRVTEGLREHARLMDERGVIVDRCLGGCGRAGGEEDGRQLCRRDLALQRTHDLQGDALPGAGQALEVVDHENAAERGHLGDEERPPVSRERR